MQNFKYHSINIATILIFSFALASTINLIVGYKLSPDFTAAVQTQAGLRPTGDVITKRPFEFYSSILDSGFFLVQNISAIAEPAVTNNNPEQVQAVDISQLTLIGTITGPAQIARAMIRNRNEKAADVFALRRIDEDISNNVYGHRLIWIGDTRVTLEANGERQTLEMYPDPTVSTQPPPGLLPPRQTADSGAPIKTTISRAELKQRSMNNLDEFMQGLVAGPHRGANNTIEGFRLSRVPRTNILYTLGARNGDIIKRINGRPANSTEQLLQMWQLLSTENQITIDLERSNRLMTYEINIIN